MSPVENVSMSVGQVLLGYSAILILVVAFFLFIWFFASKLKKGAENALTNATPLQKNIKITYFCFFLSIISSIGVGIIETHQYSTVEYAVFSAPVWVCISYLLASKIKKSQVAFIFSCAGYLYLLSILALYL